MYSEFTAFSILSMSTSDPVTDQKPVQINEPPQSGSSADSPSPSPSTPSLKTTPCLGGLSATATENNANDGFVTPTNSDHRIPEIRSCPSPPRKSTAAGHRRMRSVKRKRSADDVWSRRDGHRQSTPPLLLDLSSEIESMFPPILQADLTCKIKKARSV